MAELNGLQGEELRLQYQRILDVVGAANRMLASDERWQAYSAANSLVGETPPAGATRQDRQASSPHAHRARNINSGPHPDRNRGPAAGGIRNEHGEQNREPAAGGSQNDKGKDREPAAGGSRNDKG